VGMIDSMSASSQPKIAVETAMMKARTVLNTLRPSKATMNEVISGRSAEIRLVWRGNFPQGGGLPIRAGGNQLIAAIGWAARPATRRSGTTKSVPYGPLRCGTGGMSPCERLRGATEAFGRRGRQAADGVLSGQSAWFAFQFQRYKQCNATQTGSPTKNIQPDQDWISIPKKVVDTQV